MIISLKSMGFCFTLNRKFNILFFNEQPVCNQLTLGWQTAKKISGLNPLSVSNNKNYALQKSKVFLDNKRKAAVKPIIQENSEALF